MIEHSSRRAVNQSDNRENDRNADCLSPVTYGAAPPDCERTALRLVCDAGRAVDRLPTERPITLMHMRIVWGRILPGQWDGFEAAYKKASAMRGEVKGLKTQWLVRDQNDRDAGYSISLWDSDEDMRAFWDSPKRTEAMAVIQPFFANQYTTTNCEVKFETTGA